ncbi:MAG: hypothetical protein M3303_02090 [Gemmatimonadota bacterium]|nr:hypothetical protein [Gemmatimonadota bacterium]
MRGHPRGSPSSSALVGVRDAQRCGIAASPARRMWKTTSTRVWNFWREPNAAVQRDDDAMQFEISHFLYITSLLA